MENLLVGQSKTVVIAEGNFAKSGSGNFTAYDAETFEQYFVSAMQMKKLGFSPENESEIKFPLFATVRKEEIPVAVRDPKTGEYVRDADNNIVTNGTTTRISVKAIYKTIEEQGNVIASVASAEGYLNHRRETAKANIGKEAIANVNSVVNASIA